MKKIFTILLANLLLTSLILTSSSSAFAQCSTVKDIKSSVVSSTSALVYWSTVSGAKSYDLVVSQVNPIPLVPINFEYKGLTILKQTVDKLTAGTTYSYTVKTNCTDGTSSELSKLGEFTTSKDNTGTGGTNGCGSIKDLKFTSDSLGTSGTLNWTAVTGATSYKITVQQISIQAVVNNFTATSNTFKLTALTAKSKYLVKIQAICPSGGGNSTAFTFETKGVSTPTSGCGQVKEIAASQKDSTSATIKWNTVSGAISYEVTVSGANAFTKTYKSVGTATTLLADLLPGAGVYTYKVRAICASGNGDWSKTSAFTIKKTIVTPPTSGCGTIKEIKVLVKDSVTALIAWKSITGAKSYEIEVTDSLGFKLTLTSINASVTASGLNGNGFYSVKIKAICSNGIGEWSKGTSFTTKKKVVDPPSTTTCSTPTGLSVKAFNTTTAQLSWNVAKNAVSYEIEIEEIATTGTTAAPIIKLTSKIPTIIVDNFSAGKSYKFKVKTICTAGSSEWSKYTDFKMKSNISEKVANNNSSNSVLSSSDLIRAIYPNPSHGEVNIVLNGKEGEGNLMIVNVLGSVVKSISVNAGETRQIDTNDLAAGYYFVKVKIGDKTDTKRLMVQ